MPSNVKQNVASFVPRQEITDKLKKTFADHPEGSTIILTGQRGAGKTQIARYVCQEHEKSEAERLVLELDAGNSTILLDEYRRLGGLLGLQLKDDEKPQDVQLRVKNALLKLKHPFMMLFFDNAYDYATIAPYLFPSSNDKVLYSLVTSYNTAIWNGIQTVIPIRPPLQPEFTPKEAMIYIKNARNLPEVNDEDANQLAELLHYHPLALTQAVSYILKDSTIEEFCQKYKEIKPKPLDEKLEGDYPESVVNVTDFALEKLNDSAKEILYACSLLHSKNIPKRLIEEALHPLLYQNSIQELQSFSLLTRSDDASGNTPVYYELHELTQEIVRYRLSPDKKAIQIQLLDFFENKLENYTETLSLEKGTLREKEYLKQLLRHAESFLKYIDISNLSAEQDKKYANFLLYMGDCFYWHADYEKARNMHEQALKIKIATHGDNHPEVVTSLNNLGAVLHALGQYEAAKEKYEEALKISRVLYGDNHPEVAAFLSNLGEVLYVLGQYEASKEKHEEALKIYRAIYGNNHLKEASFLNNLGEVLCSLGQYETAKEKFEEALKISRVLYGDNHPDAAISLNNLGAMLYILEQYEAAKEKFKEALKINRVLYGDNHPRVATCLNHLGNLLDKLEQYEAAKEKYEQALKINRAAYGDNHLRVATCLNHLGNVLDKLGQYEAAAKEKQEQALEIMIKIAAHECNHLEVAAALNHLRRVPDALEQTFEKLLTHYLLFQSYYRVYKRYLSHKELVCDKIGLIKVFKISFKEAVEFIKKMNNPIYNLEINNISNLAPLWENAYDILEKEFSEVGRNLKRSNENLKIEQVIGHFTVMKLGEFIKFVEKTRTPLSYFLLSYTYEMLGDRFLADETLAKLEKLYASDVQVDASESQIKRERDAKEELSEKGSVLSFSSSSTVPSVAGNPYQFHGNPMEASIYNSNETKGFDDYLKVTKENRELETVYEFNLTGLWQNSDEVQKLRLREEIEKLHFKNRGKTMSDGNTIKISFLKDDAQSFLDELKEILSLDNSILPGEELLENVQMRRDLPRPN